MPYNPKTQATIIISKEHKEMLRQIAQKQRRSLRATIELLIEQAEE